ncbi:MAG: hypothetical protein JWQ43_55 [Glaciihabitans sp.]|nr:hypothetical protein [Glaciihabitans sp.]
MTSSAPGEVGPLRDANVAMQEIRLAEATRVLGMLEAGALDAEASGWLLDGVDSPSLHSLAKAADADQLILLADTARELGLSFRSVQDARAFHINAVLAEGNMRVAMESFSISNNFSDHLSSAFRRMVDVFTGCFRKRG